MEIPYILRQVGLSDKEIRVYLALLSCGASSAKRLSKDTELPKSAVSESLAKLQDSGLISAFQKHKKQQYAAEDPEKLLDLVVQREQNMLNLKRRVNELLPELKSIYSHGGNRSTIKYYEGLKGVDIILKDVLTSMTEHSGDKCYRVFSSPRLRQFIYTNFPHFTKERIARGIRVKVLVTGDEQPSRPLMEQKSIPVSDSVPTYCFVYLNKISFISIDSDDNVSGVIIDDANIAGTQKIIFDHIWNQFNEKRRISVEAMIAEHL
ncbi:MAG: helix-turn-helix domain-containing protein [Patescibacteria group bacterium]